MDHIFLTAIEISDELERARYLERACQNNPNLHAQVTQLLANVTRLGDFLETPAIFQTETVRRSNDLLIARDLSETQIGSFRLLERVGSGGMGEVYRAFQETPIQRQVAIKVIRDDLITDQIIARFHLEQQAISMMNHPNIAMILDAGTATIASPSRQMHAPLETYQESPFFSMEYVDGIAITKYCDQKCLSIEERIRLLIPVCQAVHHAHQKGIIHRDLKPSNILVTECDGHPVPKVIDFGIAKAIGQGIGNADQFSHTQNDQILGTLEFMSPEQAKPNNHDIDTRTDIYSLGVVLHVLLTDSTPFALNRLAAGERSSLFDVIMHTEPRLPSQTLSDSARTEEISASRRTSPRRLLRQIRGDLDCIILKCLDKQPCRRYESSMELAHDLRRFLNAELVQARPSSILYKWNRTIRKNGTAIIVSSAFVSVLIIASVISLRMALVARRAEAQAKENLRLAESQKKQTDNVNEFMRDILANIKSNEKGANIRLVDSLSDASLQASRRFADNPIQEASIHAMLADVYADLTMLSDAVHETKQALELLQKYLPINDPKILVAEVRYAQALMNQVNYRDAEEIMNGLLPRVEKAFDSNHPVVFDAQRLSIALLKNQKRYRECIDELTKLRARATAAQMDDTTQISILQSLVSAWRTQLGLGNRQRQIEVVREIEDASQEMAMRSLRRNGPRASATIKAKVNMAEMVVCRGEFEKGIETCEDILSNTLFPLGANHQFRLAAMHILAKAKHRMGRSQEAAELELNRIEFDRTGSNNLVSLISKISDALPYLDTGGRWTEGETLAREYVAVLDNLPGHGNLQLAASGYVARFVSLQSRTDEAEELFQELLRQASKNTQVDNAHARLHLFYAKHLRTKQRYADAEHHLQLATSFVASILEGTCQTNPDDIVREYRDLYSDWDRPQEMAKFENMLRNVQYSLASPEISPPLN